jgi:hypothetical protein
VNPYQYKILNLLTGTILINPLASGYYERYWRGTRPLEAYVSYYVHDWTIMREEFTVPSSGAHPTRVFRSEAGWRPAR